MQQLYKAGLQDLIKMQSDGSMNNIELHLGNKSKIVNLKIPLMFIIGDIQASIFTVFGLIKDIYPYSSA